MRFRGRQREEIWKETKWKWEEKIKRRRRRKYKWRIQEKDEEGKKKKKKKKLRKREFKLNYLVSWKSLTFTRREMINIYFLLEFLDACIFNVHKLKIIKALFHIRVSTSAHTHILTFSLPSSHTRTHSRARIHNTHTH